MVNDTAQVKVCIADRKIRTSMGLAHNVCIGFMPVANQRWDFWVVPLAMDAILGTPLLKGVLPTIGWGTQWVNWVHKGKIVLAYGHESLPKLPPECPRVEIVSTKCFLRDTTRSSVYREVSWAGVLQMNAGTLGHGAPE